jgi:hypothetical protein
MAQKVEKLGIKREKAMFLVLRWLGVRKKVAAPRR